MGGESLSIHSTLTCQGGGLARGDLSAGQVKASIKGERLLLIRRNGLKIRGDVDITAEGPIADVLVSGRVALQDSKFVKRLSLIPDLKMAGGAGGGSPFGPWSVGDSGLKFDVRLTTLGPVLLRTNVLDADLDVGLRLTGTGDNMHLRGSYAKYTAYYPDGTEEVLLEVPKYDFNWQTQYEYEILKQIPAGTRIEFDMHFDNSKEKGDRVGFNADRPVKFGGPTTDEMDLGWFTYSDSVAEEAGD